MHQRRLPLSLLLLILSSPGRAGDLTLTTGIDYSTGKYGTTSATDIYYVPVTAKYEFGRTTLKATVPYLRITSGAGPRTTADGPGDVVTSLAYSVFEKPRGNLLLDVLGKIKWGTADAGKGLGNGKNAYSLQLDAYYLAGALTPFATLGYRVPEDPPGVVLENAWFGTLGLGYKISSVNSAGFMWDLRQASRSAGGGAVVDADGRPASSLASNDATLYWVHKFTPDYKIQVYTSRGFSDASAGHGFGMMISGRF